MKIQILGLLSALLRPTAVAALFAEEIGVNDFLIATTGHGSIQTVFTHTNGVDVDAVLTSDSLDAGKLVARSTTSCFVALRNVHSGSLIWRLNVCSASAKDSYHVVVASNESFFTVDHTGLLRAWTMTTGALLWDAPTGSDAVRLWAPGGGVVVASLEESLVFYNTLHGRVMGTFSAAAASASKGSGTATWLAVMTVGDQLYSLIGWVQNDMVTHLTKVVMKLDEGTVSIQSAKSLPNHAKFLASSLQVIQGAYVLGLGVDGASIVQVPIMTSESSLQIEISQLHPLWTSMETLELQPGGLLRVKAVNSRYSPPRFSTGLFRFDGKESWDQWYDTDGSEETNSGAIGYCPHAFLVFSFNDQDASMTAYHVGAIPSQEHGRLTRDERHRRYSPLTPIQVEGEVISVTDDISGLFVLVCNANSATFLVTTKMGTTVTAVLSVNSLPGAKAKIAWTSEEGMASISSGLLLDASHSSAIVDAASEEEQKKALQALSLSSRLQSQMETLIGMFSSFSAIKSREDEFGFSKVAVLLSQKAHRVWGVPTAGNSRGKPRWMMDLPDAANRHVLVQGNPSSFSNIHGINGGTHSHEVLILSVLPDETKWTCLDGITGKVHNNGSSPTPTPIRQIIPVFGGGSCRQVAILMLEDGTVTVIPSDETAMAAVSEKINTNENGFYTHVLSKRHSSMETFQVIDSKNSSAFATRLVGRTSFDGERILNVAYPGRDEIVQSPCNILGDDSLLLKYLNPHLAAVVTMSDPSGSRAGILVDALNPRKGVSGITKPKGVTTALNDGTGKATVESLPNLFVNLVDTVSGRILYRASHTNAAESDSVPVLISENWVIYAFFNEMTKRSELGVLSLHEGMIDKTGLTAFSAPEQASSFSSLTARESKPVVLPKSYTIMKPITALGVTLTKSGISTKQILIATGDDRITSIPRNLLEPRRPTGVVKDVEKEEGLFQYHPLVPLITLQSPSYNQTIHSVTTIMSATTDLESQSLILAFGGPDIFFSRVAPSKGFDLLPEDFNRILLSIVVVGILVVLVVVKSVSGKKTVQLGWIDFKK